jgi:hypothetical protein
MTRLGMTLLCALQVAATSALADNLIEPGQWKVTATTVMNGAATPPQAKARCLTPEQVGDVAKTLGLYQAPSIRPAKKRNMKRTDES